MSDVVHVDDGNFEEKVMKEEKPVLVDFAAEWCGPCKTMAPIIEELATEYAGKAVVAHLDVDKAPDTAQKYRVMSVPTVILFKGGEAVAQKIGLQSKKVFADMIKEAAGS